MESQNEVASKLQCDVGIGFIQATDVGFINIFGQSEFSWKQAPV